MNDVLIVSLGSTAGLRRADEQLREALARAGAGVELARARPPREVRTLMLTDLGWARAARVAALADGRLERARAVIYSSTTASLLWPRPGAIRFDAPAAGNRPGRHGLWQRPLERARLRRAPLLIPWSEGALREIPGVHGPALVLPVAVERSTEPAQVEPSLERARGESSPERATGESSPGGRDIAAVTYGANPLKKGLDRVLAAWSRARREGEELLVAGIAQRALARAGLSIPEGVRVTGMLDYREYRALLGRARVFVCGARREDYGITQLEALAEGCQLVTRASAGPYVALPIARRLDARLVGEDLAGALRIALDDPRPEYFELARRELEPFSRAALDRQVAEELLPRLLG
jgi:glycosyltransferase involved in cell wall biosynthesis